MLVSLVSLLSTGKNIERLHWKHSRKRNFKEFYAAIILVLYKNGIFMSTLMNNCMCVFSCVIHERKCKQFLRNYK